MFGWLIIILIILIGARIWFNLNWGRIKGAGGERFIKRKLGHLNPAQYIVFNDILIPSRGNTPTTQIDHVVVSNYGIFVIETKDYDGRIFGDANQEYWTRVIYKYKDRIRNPIWQNYGHIKAIQELIKSVKPNILIVPFVAFPVTDKLKVSGTNCVGHGRDLINKISSYEKETITDSERDRIVAILENANIQDKEARKKHIRDIKELK